MQALPFLRPQWDLLAPRMEPSWSPGCASGRDLLGLLPPGARAPPAGQPALPQSRCATSIPRRAHPRVRLIRKTGLRDFPGLGGVRSPHVDVHSRGTGLGWQKGQVKQGRKSHSVRHGAAAASDRLSFPFLPRPVCAAGRAAGPGACGGAAGEETAGGDKGSK